MFIFRHLTQGGTVVFDGEGGGGGGASTENQLAEAKRKQERAEQQAREAAALAADQKKRADEMQARIDALETKDASELEKAQRDLAKANEKIESLTGENTTLKGDIATRDKRDIVRDVLTAEKMGVHDVSALDKFIDFDKVTDKDSAKTALQELQGTHKFLFTDGTPAVPPTPQPFGSPAGGTPTQIPAPGALPQQQVIANEQQAADAAKRQLGTGLLSALDAFRGGRPQQQ